MAVCSSEDQNFVPPALPDWGCRWQLERLRSLAAEILGVPTFSCYMQALFTVPRPRLCKKEKGCPSDCMLSFMFLSLTLLSGDVMFYLIASVFLVDRQLGDLNSGVPSQVYRK